MRTVNAWAAASAGAPLGPTTITRREPGPRDVELDILFAGICHSDVHQARDEWGGSRFPMVPGHEIVGRVRRVGADVTRFRPGDLGAIGCFVDSCRRCEHCLADDQPFCSSGVAWTYNGTEMDRATPTQGGYSAAIVADQDYVLRVPAGLDPAAAAPLLCAGITTYSPLVEWGVTAGQRVAVLGLGGLGHMAVKLAAAMGAEVTVISRSRKKAADAARLGAAHFADASRPRELLPLAGRFHLIIDTVSADHGFDEWMRLLRPRGTLALVGLPSNPSSIGPFSLVNGNRRLVGSNIGGLARTQQMLELCAARGITSDVEIIQPPQINEAYERLVASDVRYRFVIDTSSLAG